MKWNSCNKLWDELSPLLFLRTLLANGKIERGINITYTIQYCKILIVCIHLTVLFLFLLLPLFHIILLLYLYYIYIYFQMACTFILRIARITATIFIHNNRLNECQLQSSVPITNGVRYVCTLHSMICDRWTKAALNFCCCFWKMEENAIMVNDTRLELTVKL